MKQLHRSILSVFFVILCFSNVSAQRLNHILGDLLIRPEAGVDMNELTRELQYFGNSPTQLMIIEQISAPLNIWQLHFDHNEVHEYHFLAYLNRHPKIAVVQFNHLVEMRETTPDDALFSDQWQYINDGSNGGVVGADIDADLAWDITTGGVTVQGDTIVVAVLDSGLDLNHEDFGDNIWVNHAEIPNNGMDDDNNGYIDDYRGWSTVTNNDDISPSGGHGTAVAGIVGAQGNNGIGVTGVNWDVKVMVIKNNFNTNEAAVLEAYSYALEARIKYNETNGAEGAFVVSTNASWGIDFGNPDDAPLWCSFYDTLGQAGIISCGATINGNQDVDQIGDLPTACPSDFLISVTNMDRTDNKVTGAGYGATTIDLGAHGAETYTAALGNTYGGFGGTSGATPHVAGALALLYSAPCDNLSALAKSNPAAAATLVRQYIFDGVDANASLQGITTTGGRLNLFNSVQLVMNNCSPCPPSFSLDVMDLTDTNASLIWTAGVNANSSNLRWRQVGNATWNDVNNVTSPYLITNLSPCTDYEFQVDAVCDSENSGYTQSFVFKTDGCCEAPTGLSISTITNNSATVEWNSVLAAVAYNLMVTTPLGSSTFEVTTTSFELTDLMPCTPYNVSIQTVCAGELTDFTAPIEFTTFGCGACIDMDYCATVGENADFEWISSVNIADLTNDTESDDGYGDYTGTSANVETFNTYAVSLSPGFLNNAFDEHFKVWIDFDHNGVFDPVTELAFDGGASNSTVSGTMTVPGDATLGLTRMRVSMKWAGISGDEEPEPCETFGFGEVEDYCIMISEGTIPNCDMPTDLDTIQVLEEEATLTWIDASDDHTDHNLRVKKIADTDWTVYPNVSAPYTLTNLDDCTDYEFQVEANCVVEDSISGYTDSHRFVTKCIISTNNLLVENRINIFPNPFNTAFQVELDLTQPGAGHVQILDTKGQMVYQQLFEVSLGTQVLEIKGLEEIAAGVYFIGISTPEGSVYQKLMKF